MNLDPRLVALFRSSWANAEKRQIPWAITLDQFGVLVNRAGGRCQVTGIPFEYPLREKGSRNPFAASIDRVDSTRGYSPDNVRLVISVLNLAMNEWGIGPVLRMAEALTGKRGESPMATGPHADSSRILRPREVATLVGLSRQTIWRLVRSGEFPAPIQLTRKSIGWKENHVMDWLERRCGA